MVFLGGFDKGGVQIIRAGGLIDMSPSQQDREKIGLTWVLNNLNESITDTRGQVSLLQQEMARRETTQEKILEELKRQNDLAVRSEAERVAKFDELQKRVLAHEHHFGVTRWLLSIVGGVLIAVIAKVFYGG